MEPSKPGQGRGGRGAKLLAALQLKTRRPGDSDSGSSPAPSTDAGSSSQDVEPTTSGSSRGRGAALSQFLLSGSGSAPSSISKGTSSPSSFGRGASSLISTPSTSESTIPSLSSQMSRLDLSHSVLKDSGTHGELSTVEVNYVKLNVEKDYGVFEYHVTFNPLVENSRTRFRLLNHENVVAVIGKTKQFDGMKLYLPFKLEKPVQEIESQLLIDGSQYTVTLKYVGQAGERDIMTLYNILFRRIMYKLKLMQIGKNYFDPTGKIPVPQHKLEIWPGLVTAIHEYKGGILLNCDASFRVLRTMTVMDILQEIYHTKQNTFKETVLKELIGCVVLTRYNNKTYRIDDIAWNLTPRHKFLMRNGEEMSYVDYYKNTYDITIKDLKQPLLVHIPRRKKNDQKTDNERIIHLIPEISCMTGLSDQIRKDFRVMKDISVHTRVTPNQRLNAMKKFLENIRLNAEAQKILSDWHIEIETAAVKFDARIVKNETLLMKNGQFPINKEADFTRDVMNNHVICAVDLKTWLLICTKRDTAKAHDYIQTVRRVSPQLGINVSEPCLITLHDDNVQSYLTAIKKNYNPEVQLVVTIMPTPRDDRYAAIKTLCCAEMSVPSQVINARTLSDPKKLRSVAQKIALQINCKLGGELWAVEIPLKKLMVCGIDSHHDPTKKGRSAMGFVSSINSTCTRWFSKVDFHDPGQEVGDHLKVTFLEALKAYYEVNNCLPETIIVFRDGVGDGLLQHVQEYEARQLSSAFTHFGQNYNPSITFVVVQKRINTRIFASQNKNLANPIPGTVVDHTIGRKDWFDFYLVSQHVRQGTVTPTHYVVIYDTSRLSADHIQRLSYKLTHLYYNWTGTVRVPAPCQYAHKLAQLVGQHIHKNPQRGLNQRLYFL